MDRISNVPLTPSAHSQSGTGYESPRPSLYFLLQQHPNQRNGTPRQHSSQGEQYDQEGSIAGVPPIPFLGDLQGVARDQVMNVGVARQEGPSLLQVLDQALELFEDDQDDSFHQAVIYDGKLPARVQRRS